MLINHLSNNFNLTTTNRSISNDSISFCRNKKNQKKEQQELEYKKALEKDLFEKRKEELKHAKSEIITKDGKKFFVQRDKLIPVEPYKNIFEERLKATPKPDLKESLKKDYTIYNINLAEERISSLSKYLKEGMVGFITPDGEHWFEKALKFFIEGSAGIDLSSEQFETYGPNYSKQFWELMTRADDYWTSDQFLNYLSNNMNQEEPGVKITIRTIKSLRGDFKTPNSQISFGYSSKIRYIPELHEIGGAYTGDKLRITSIPNDPHYPSLEHIFPHDEGGDIANLDCNYLLATPDANSYRGDMPLIAFLKGWDIGVYRLKHPDWENKLRKHLKINKIINTKTNKINPFRKLLAKRLINKLESGKIDRKELFNVSKKTRDAIITIQINK